MDDEMRPPPDRRRTALISTGWLILLGAATAVLVALALQK